MTRIRRRLAVGSSVALVTAGVALLMDWSPWVAGVVTFCTSYWLSGIEDEPEGRA